MSNPRMHTPTDGPVNDAAGRNAARPDRDDLTEQLHGLDEGAPTTTGGDLGNESARSGFSGESPADRVGGDGH